MNEVKHSIIAPFLKQDFPVFLKQTLCQKQEYIELGLLGEEDNYTCNAISNQDIQLYNISSSIQVLEGN